MIEIDWMDPKDAPRDGRRVLLLVRTKSRYGDLYAFAITAFFMPRGFIGSGRWVNAGTGETFDGEIAGYAEVAFDRLPFKPIAQVRGDGYCTTPTVDTFK